MLPTTGEPAVSSSYRLGDGSVVMGCTWRTVFGASCAAFKIRRETADLGVNEDALERLLRNSRAVNVHGESAPLGRRRRWALKLVLIIVLMVVEMRQQTFEHVSGLQSAGDAMTASTAAKERANHRPMAGWLDQTCTHLSTCNACNACQGHQIAQQRTQG